MSLVERDDTAPVAVDLAPRGLGLVRRLSVLGESKLAIASLLVVLFWVMVALLAPVIAPYSPTELVGAPLQPPGGAHLLGTDFLGRDILSRLIWGSRLILALAPLAVLIGELMGASLGLIAGYFGGVVDDVLMRILDALLAFPLILLYLLVIVATGASPVNVVWAIAVGAIPLVARIARSVVLEIRTHEFVSAARLRGESSLYVMFVEILPNALPPLVVDACLRVGYAAFAIGALGFLGLGLPPPTPDWGSMINEGRPYIMLAPWISLVPAIAISSLVVALNLFADWLRDRK
jgi:peptide/nickel transport system permease protein